MLGRNRFHNLLYLADRTIAEYIIEAKRMKIAERRIDMWEKHEQHMCLQWRCDQPVVGKKIFAHCQKHLDSSEERFLEKDVETHGFETLFDDPFGKAFTRLYVVDAEKNVKHKEEALASAYQISQAFWDERRERFTFLPTPIFERLRDHESHLFDTDEDWFFDKTGKKPKE